MKRILLLLAGLCAPVLHAAQPPSATLQLPASTPAAHLQLPALDHAKALAEDALADKDAPLRYALGHAVEAADVHADAKAMRGQWQALADGRSLWRLDVNAPGAMSLDFGFKRYRLPAGAELWIVGTQSGEVQGPFTDADNAASGEFWTPRVRGESARIELVLPADKREYLELQLDTVHQAYRDPSAPRSSFEKASGSCNVDVACPEGNAWRDEINSVVVISFSSNQSRNGLFCSGQFINSTASGTPAPLMLTANHCGITTSNAASVVAYFNFQNSMCRTPGSAASGQDGNGPLNQFVSGAQMLAQSTAEASGVVSSDFALLRFNNNPPPAANVYFTGWDRRNIAPTSATGIHHPDGSEKRISFENEALSIAAYLQPTGTGTTHLRIADWDVGTTEQGSSGSGLWNIEGRLVGVLSGGYAACGNDREDWYGRLNHFWDTGATTNRRVKEWLDPANTNVQTVDGRFACSAPAVTLNSAAFTTAPNAGQTVQFNATATGGTGALTYTWDLDGDGSADQSGSANSVSTVYNSRQSNQVRLTVTDSTNCSTTVSRALDVKGPAIDITANGAPTQICGNNDGVIDPGERWQQSVQVRNSGDAGLAEGGRAVFAPKAALAGGYAQESGATCGFGFVDIASGANAVPALTLTPSSTVAANDDGRNASAIVLGGGGLQLFGTSYPQAVMSTNGYVSFDPAESGGDYDNGCNEPLNRGALGPQLRPQHVDMVVGNQAAAGLRYRYFDTCPRAGGAGAGAGCHVFQWSNMAQYVDSSSTTGNFEFQALVYQGNGRVVYQYRTASPDAGSTATIGLVQANGTPVDLRCKQANAAPAASAICLAPASGSPLRVETTTLGLPALAPGAQANATLTFAVPATAACGAALGIEHIASAASNLSSTNPTIVMDRSVGATCKVVNNCQVQAPAIATREGLYLNPVRPGNGLASYSYGGGWYTGDSNRQPTWYQLGGNYVDNLMSLPLQQTFNAAAPNGVNVQLNERGRAWIARVDSTNLVYAWQFNDGSSGAELMQAALGASPRPSVNRTETWYAPSQSGWGLAVESAVVGNPLEAIGVFIYDSAGNPRWVLGTGTGANGAAVNLLKTRPHCPGCPFIEDQYTNGNQSAGSLTPNWTGSSNGAVNTTITFPAPLQGTWNRANLPIVPVLNPVQP